MHPYAEAQLKAVDEGLSLLEAFVTTPLGLYSDIRMLRGSASIQDRSREIDRASYKNVSSNPWALSLEALQSVRQSIEALDRLDGEEPALEDSWKRQAGRVLARIEQRVSGEIRKKRSSRIRGLYVIVDPEQTRGRSVLEVAEAALKGGASVIQLRNKSQDMGDVLPDARRLQDLCESYDATFVVNDHADLAGVVGSHGLHLGQRDLPLTEARQVLAPTQIVGTSNALLQEALESQSKGADYIAVGSMFPTSTKDNTRPAGLETLRKVKQDATVPVVAIGGINEGNVGDVVEAGADCVCVISAVMLADNPEEAAKRLVALVS